MVADGLPCARLLQFDRQHRAARVSRPHARVFLAVPTAQGEILMKNPLDSLWGTVISGLVLTVILYFVVKSILG